jgi:tetratricopeptide (TPR) repeat protein
VRSRFGDRLGEAITEVSIGLVYADQSDWNMAVPLYEKALSVFREFGTPRQEGELLNHLGVAYSAQHRWAAAIESFELSLKVLRDLGESIWEARTLVSMGQTLQETKDVAGARSCWLSALQLFERFGDAEAEKVRAYLEGL